MTTIFAILITIASILLIGVILIQKSKGGGLAANVNNYNQFMGVRKTTDFVEKATWGLAAFICALSILWAIFSPKMIVDDKPVLQKVHENETQAPNFETPVTQGEAAQAPAPAANGEAAPAAPAQGETPAAPATEGK